MPKNKGKGGKSKRKGKNKSDTGDKRELVLKEEGQGMTGKRVCDDSHTLIGFLCKSTVKSLRSWGIVACQRTVLMATSGCATFVESSGSVFG